jgi:hypothetical protein
MNERRKYEIFKVNLFFSNLSSNLFYSNPLLPSFQLAILSHIQYRKGKILYHNTSTHKDEKYSRMFSSSCSAVSNTEIKECWNLNLNIFIACDRWNNKTNVTY